MAQLSKSNLLVVLGWAVCGCSVMNAQDAATSGGGLELKRNMSRLTALLVMDTGNGQTGGGACDLIMTAVDAPSSLVADLRFNQEVGAMMASGMEAAKRAVAVRHDGIIKGKTIEISFADKFTPKDGPSASLAVAMMLDSLVTGEELRQDCAVTGDITSDGKVRPIGGLDAKIRAAAKKGAGFFVIPEGNASELSDIIVDGELKTILALQVIAATTLDDALNVAVKDRSSEATAALDSYAGLLERAKTEGGSVLSSQEAQGVLVEILEVIPGHSSARVMQMYATRNLPTRYSLLGSYARLQSATMELGAAFDALNQDDQDALDVLLSDEGLTNIYDRALKKVSVLRKKIHPDLARYEGALSNHIRLLSKLPYQARTKQRASFLRYVEQCKAMGKRVEVEDDKLRERPEFRDALVGG